jgi:dCMP deaminase
MKRWDAFFLRIAEAVAIQSLCLNRQIGAVLARGKRIISTGYNGPPEGIPPCVDRLQTHPAYNKVYKQDATNYIPVGPLPFCPRRCLNLGHGEGREWCPAVHAEVNAIANAARLGLRTKGSTLYLTCGIPCKNCLGVIINSGVDEVVCTSLDAHDDLTHWLLSFPTLRIRTYE